MDFNQMLPTLQSQASRIFNGDKDSIQDALAMAYLNYSSCLARKNHQLSIGELINFIKYRATELNNETLPHFGNIKARRTTDVYFKKAYLEGKVKRLSLDYVYGENKKGNLSSLAYLTGIPSNEDDILFNIDFAKFRKQLNRLERELLDWLLYGLNRKEISRVMQLNQDHVRTRLRQIGFKFAEFFQCRDAVVVG